MKSETIARNLRQLRQEKGLTQEELAVHLGISAQSVSRWECGNTLPDVLLLPELARLYGVTVDDLFREKATAYPSYAQRLLAVYESSGRSEDFLAAEQEFLRMEPEGITGDDLRAWGVLYHYRMKQCAESALRKLEQAMDYPEAALSAAQQKIALLCDQGRGSDAVADQDRALEQNREDPRQWLLSAAARHMAGENERALEAAREGLRRFPDYGLLSVYAGDICRALKRYGEAFAYWNRARELDPSALDALYSMASCREELGEYDHARKLWEDLARELTRRGMAIESEYPAQRARNCGK